MTPSSGISARRSTDNRAPVRSNSHGGGTRSECVFVYVHMNRTYSDDQCGSALKLLPQAETQRRRGGVFVRVALNECGRRLTNRRVHVNVRACVWKSLKASDV
ncbi:hypothetical protein BIW11_02778 [Tropilaelaps mercedesae]|uniref:Uncharacterized protein n=1 Tax=Tropilaelaps mercedesae TaxID=418985 RepID=A0A1V9XXJ5_9ACAR|nr:hypothetical protein BIW11_02778 [Tropilaelaps mercedesae]